MNERNLYAEIENKSNHYHHLHCYCYQSEDKRQVHDCHDGPVILRIASFPSSTPAGTPRLVMGTEKSTNLSCPAPTSGTMA